MHHQYEIEEHRVYMEASAVLDALSGRNYLEVVISEITKAIWYKFHLEPVMDLNQYLKIAY